MSLLTLAATSLPDVGPLALLEAAAAAGFDGVGLRLNWPPSRTQREPCTLFDTGTGAALKRRLEETGLIVLDIYSLYLTANFDFEAARKHLELGAALGARCVVTIGHDTQWPRLRDTFGKLCDLAAPLGLRISAEFAPHRHPTTLREARQLLAEVRRPNAAIMPDPAHLVASGGVVADLKSLHPATIAHSQICGVDVVGEEYSTVLARTVPKVARTVPGAGCLELADWLDALPAGLPLSVECPPRQPGIPAARWAKVLHTAALGALGAYRRRAPP